MSTMDIGFYFKLFLRRLHYFLIFLVLGTAAGVSVALMLPPVYSAQATLAVENPQIPAEMAQSTVATGAAAALPIIRQQILSRANLIDLSNDLEIFGAPGSAQRREMTPDAMVSDLRRRIQINTGGRNGGNIVRVSFSAPSGPIAADVTNAVVTQILEANVELRRGASGQTLEFFEDEVERLDQELARREAELLAFQNEHLNALPDSLEFRRGQQAAAQERLSEVERQETALRDRRDRLVTLYETTGEVVATQDRPRSPREVQLAQLREELALARTVLSDANPRLQNLELRVAAMETLVTEERALATGTVDNENTQLSAYEVQLADIDGQLEFLETQKTQILGQMERLQETIEATPANAIRLDSMRRDYAAVQGQYQQAVGNRARAETGDVIENLSKGQRISVIEPAVAPSSPSSPDRTLISAAGVVFGGAMGLGLIVLLELLNSSIRRPVDLQNRLGITPFGTLPLLRTPGQVRRRRALISLAFVAVAVGVPVGIWLLHTQVMPLDEALEKVLDKAGLGSLSLPF